MMLSSLSNFVAPSTVSLRHKTIAPQRDLDYASELPKFTEWLQEVEGKNYNEMQKNWRGRFEKNQA